MNVSLTVLFSAGVGYLLILFLVAYATERGWLPESIVRHPLTYILSLGVYATSWSFYGSVGYAAANGYNFLTIYLGVTLAFILSPILLMPILRLARDYQLTSLADLFAFRYRSQLAGVLVTLFMLVGSLPYITLQIRAVTETAGVLTHETPPQILALGFCLTLASFAVLFGARHASPREKHTGLVAAIAFESLVKLAALLALGGYAVFGVFGGFGELNQWLAKRPEALDALYDPVREGPWATLLLLSFAASFLLPRQFHMAFTENLNPEALRVASWGFPLFLLLLNLAIPPILWAGQVEVPMMKPDYFGLGITLTGHSGVLPVLTFIGGLSAASAMMIVTSLALSAMCLNHLILPAHYPSPGADLYRWLLWVRRMLIVLIIMAGYGFYLLLEHTQSLVELGLISFVAVAQFLPGIVGTLFWRRATRTGFLAGLTAGAAVWFVVLLIPIVEKSAGVGTDIGGLLAGYAQGWDAWTFATFWTLSANVLCFVVGSLLGGQSEAERLAAQSCCSEAMALPVGSVSAASPADFTRNLAHQLGQATAEREVAQALRDLGIDENETRAGQLIRLRDRIERNLSGLIGPQPAHVIVNHRLELDTGHQATESMRFLEEHLEHSRDELRGRDAQLDALRRFHRRILMDLPLGVCAVDARQQVVIWNSALEVCSGIESHDAVGQPLAKLPAPWNDVLSEFAAGGDKHCYRLELRVDGKPRWLDLHKARVDADAPTTPIPGVPTVATAMLLEDLTETRMLEAELAHSERLASVGRLAAGVAHEIGNPVTGIASVAQNLRHDNKNAAVREAIDMILSQTGRITGIVRSLMSFSHGGAVDIPRATIAVQDLLEEAIRLVQLDRAAKQVRCEYNGPPGLKVTGDRPRLLQVMVNLLNNACDASRPGDRVDVFAMAETDGRVRVEIMDQGVGMTREARERMFEPFFTTKDPGEGTGLGLSLAHKIIQDHRGRIDVDSEPGVGARISVILPPHEEHDPQGP